MFRIYDGRDYFYQWDIDRKIIVEDASITEVHFCNRTDDCSLICEVYSEGNLRVANVPNILLQDNWRINVYAYDGCCTKHATAFEVKRRSKPADYVYTETEIKNYDDLMSRLEQIEQNGVSDEQIANALSNYLDENPIEVDMTGYATESYVDDAIKEIELTPGPAGPTGPQGEPGPAGEPGYTPVKGVDYFDGAPGAEGPAGKDGQDGKDYVLTEADKNAIALLAIELMPAAEEGEY